MPISNFSGNTFVAFIDISGFKELMRQGEAWKALDKFYQLGYDILNEERDSNIEGLFISDCGILFVRSDKPIDDKLQDFLKVIEKINKGMLELDYMLTTSIAYGKFKYQQRIEFEGIEKNPVFGDAYLKAYLDHENGHPHIQPGQCRIVVDGLPEEIIHVLRLQENSVPVFKKIISEGEKHYYYYWSVKNGSNIASFKTKYSNSYNLKYSGMLKALKT
jgi:hypothetical protein